MNIQLPNGQKHILEDDLTLDEKKQVVEELTSNWMTIIKRNWQSNSVRFFLDSLANYLVWHKEEEDKGYEDKYVLSKKKVDKLSNHRKNSKTVNFSDLSADEKEALFGERGAE